MLALSSQVFPAFVWPNADDISCQEQYNYFDHTEHAIQENFLHFRPSKPNFDIDNCSPPSTNINGDPTVVKKINHNASERDRRKKINFLYFTLRSLLPNADQTKKLSIPGTISHALKCIPELQQQVQRLAEIKEYLVSKISMKQDDIYHQGKKRKTTVQSTLSTTVLASWAGDRQVAVQISAPKLQRCSLSDILLLLEEEGLMLINSSTSESFSGRVFHNLHLQVERTLPMDCEALREKILSLYEKRIFQ